MNMDTYITTQNAIGICIDIWKWTSVQHGSNLSHAPPKWWLVQHNKSHPFLSVSPFFLLMEPNAVDYGRIIFFRMLDGIKVECTTFSLMSKQRVTSVYIMSWTVNDKRQIPNQNSKNRIKIKLETIAKVQVYNIIEGALLFVSNKKKQQPRQET